MAATSTHAFLCCHNETLTKQLQQFWHIENLATQNNFSLEEKACERHYEENVQRSETGRYVVALPLKDNVGRLGDSRASALRQFQHLECRLLRDPEAHSQYAAVLKEYIDLGHMSLVPPDESEPTSACYLPHHAVFKTNSTTTKVRVVFNASAKTSSGMSLNDIQMTGPTIQPDLFSALIRFRKYRYAIVGDIAKMYRQVQIQESDRCLQRIFWRNSPNDPISVYELNTVTFGMASAPFLAIRTLNQLASDEYHRYPTAADILSYHFYVDDLLTGDDDRASVIKIKSELCELLTTGGFELRKLVSNDKGIVPKESETSSDVVNTLGLLWDSKNDKLQLTFTQLTVADKITKRSVLAQIGTIFDPIGLAAPVVFTAKVFMQKLWSYRELVWDDTLSESLCEEWLSFYNEFNFVGDVSIPRQITSHVTITRIEVHGFGDASEKGYGACIYIRTCNQYDEWDCRLLCSKSKVTPKKGMTIARAELCAALCLAQLYDKIREPLGINFDGVQCWSDSEITLYRINSLPSKYATFVANRVSQIQDLVLPICWSFVPGDKNPADLVSRGCMPSELNMASTWWSGPEFLRQSEELWPEQKSFSKSIDDDIEVLHTAAALTTVTELSEPYYNKFSNLNYLLRTVAHCLRFSKYCRQTPSQRLRIEITAEDLDNALLKIIRGIQLANFSDEIKLLLNKKPLLKSNPLAKLVPFIDDQGLLRVGGRLMFSDLPSDQKHQLLLPAKNHFCHLLVRSEHLKNEHVGVHSLISFTRQRFWILGLSGLCKKVVFECVRCFKCKPHNINQLMGQLPHERVHTFRAFENIGIDFCGPFLVVNKIRSNVVSKCYIALFVCFSTKATHLEVVSELTTRAFLMALRRFIGRRGRPLKIYSDNATNFVGARIELRDLQKLFNSELHRIEVLKYCAEEGIMWHTIPARSPHFGGLWEAAVKNSKHHLKRELGNNKCTLEELSTIIVQVESCLNSRPLTALSNDPSDMSVLTPGHFLIGCPMNAMPDPSLMHLDFNRLARYQRLQYILQRFWQRWSREYLSELQERRKWSRVEKNIQVGNLVLLKEDNLPPLKWLMGRVTRFILA